MVQHILPQGLHRLRYDGLHATCKHQRVRLLLKTIWVAMGRAIKGTYRVVARKTYREWVLASMGHDPLRCACCGGSMMLWKVWHPRYGVVYDELEAIRRGRYGPRGVGPPGVEPEASRVPLEQLWLPFMQGWSPDGGYGYAYLCRV